MRRGLQGISVCGSRGIGNVEGLIATTSIHQKTRVAPESIIRVLDAYGKVQPNLLLHEKGYPTATVLEDKVRHVLPVYRMAGVGEGHDSPGSEFPAIFFVVSPGYSYAHASWLGMSFPMPGLDTAVTSNDWLARNIQLGHGPLGAAYPDVAYGMEGDTPSFLDLIDNGLNDPEHPDYGGWGGRFKTILRCGSRGRRKAIAIVIVRRFRGCFRPYAANLYDVPVTAPMVDSAVTIHFILKVTDKGTPPLTRYKRVIVTVLPK